MTPNELSPEAIRRKEAIRAQLQVELTRVIQRRRRHRRAVMGGVACATVAAAAWLIPMLQPGAPAPTAPIADATPRPRIESHVVIERFADNPPLTAVHRSMERVNPKIVGLSDEDLLDALANMGRVTGLVRKEGRVTLTAAVTDDLVRDSDAASSERAM